MVNDQPPHPPLYVEIRCAFPFSLTFNLSEFCIAVSGFRLNDLFCQPLFTPSYSTPTLHILGKTDVVVVEERSKQLIDVSSNKRVEEHTGGMAHTIFTINLSNVNLSRALRSVQGQLA
jgi:hypothetical protein